jgi:hypothetical protein
LRQRFTNTRTHACTTGELKEALLSWQWEVANPTKEAATQFVREYAARATRDRSEGV